MKLAMLSDVFNEEIDLSDLYKAIKTNEIPIVNGALIST